MAERKKNEDESDAIDTTEPARSPEGETSSAIAPWLTVSKDELKRDLHESRMAAARIPARYRNKSLDGFIATDKRRKTLVEAAREYVHRFCNVDKGDAEGVFLQGKVGCGKTHLAVAMLREIIAAGYSGLYCNVPEFLKEVRATYGDRSGPDESELIDETREVDLLVLDDLGVEGRVLDPVRDRSKWLCERLYLIINGRYETGRPIIVTSNCGFEALIDQFDERTVSRLAEMTRARFPAFPDEDYRRKHLAG